MGIFSTKTAYGLQKSDNKAFNEAQLSKKLLEEYSSSRDEYAKNALINYKFRDGAQFTKEELDTLAERRHAAISWNLVLPLIDNLISIITSNDPRFQAIGTEDSDGRIADLVSNILEYLWVQNNGKQHLEAHADDFCNAGMGVWLAWGDPDADGGRGEVHFQAIDPLSVYIDPASRDRFARDAHNILIATEYSESQVLDHYKGFIERKDLEKLTQSKAIRRPSIQNNYMSPEEYITGNIGSTTHGIDSTLEEEVFYEVIERYTKIQVMRCELEDFPNKRTQLFEDEQAKQEYLEGLTIVVVEDRPMLSEQMVQTYTELATQQGESQSGDYFAHYAMDENTGNPTLVPGPEEMSDMPEAVIPDSTITFNFVSAQDVKEQLIQEGLLREQNYEVGRVKRIISIDSHEIDQQIIEVSQIPVIPVMNRHSRNPYPKGDVEHVRGLQRFYNKLSSLVMAHAANSASPKLLVPTGSDIEAINEQMSKAGFGTVEIDLDFGQPVPIQVPPLSGQVYELLKSAEMKMKQIIGVYDLMAGDSSAAPPTYHATLAFEEFGQRRMRSKRDVIEHGLTLLGKVMFELTQVTYSENKIIRTFDANYKSEVQTTLNQPIYDELSRQVVDRLNDLSTMKADVRLISGSTLPSNRWARFEQAKELYNLRLVDQEAVLKEADFPDKDKIMERMAIMQQMQQQMQTQQEEIDKLKGDMQTRERELFHARQRTELEKFKSTLKDGEVQAMRENDKILDDGRVSMDKAVNEFQTPLQNNQQQR